MRNIFMKIREKPFGFSLIAFFSPFVVTAVVIFFLNIDNKLDYIMISTPDMILCSLSELINLILYTAAVVYCVICFLASQKAKGRQASGSSAAVVLSSLGMIGNIVLMCLISVDLSGV